MPASIRVLGVVPDESTAEQVVGNLRLAGFGQNDVSFLIVEPEKADKLNRAATDQTGKGLNKTLRGVVRGVVIGVVIGLILGYAIHALIPAIRDVLHVGVMLGLFAGVGIIIGAFAGAFSTENNAGQVIERYGFELRTGQAIVAVDVPDPEIAKRAEEILHDAGVGKVNSFLTTEEEVSEVADNLPGVTEASPRAVKRQL